MDICPKGAISYVFALSKTPKPSDKPAEKKGVLNKALRRALISFKEIISPRALLSFSGFTIGMILSSGFGLGTVHRLLNLFVNGSFLLK
jgi:hypothetical protein